MSEDIRGFQTVDGISKYDYNFLANLPTINAEALGLGKVNNTSDNEKPVSKLQSEAMEQILSQSKTYTNEQISNISNIELIYLNLDENENDKLISSHTKQEVLDIITEEKIPICILYLGQDQGMVLPLLGIIDGDIAFGTYISIEVSIYILVVFDQEVPHFTVFENGAGISKIEQTITSSQDQGDNEITIYLTNENSYRFYIKNGSRGSQGPKPEKGIDYWTQEDQKNIVDEVVARFTNVSEVGA